MHSKKKLKLFIVYQSICYMNTLLTNAANFMAMTFYYYQLTFVIIVVRETYSDCSTDYTTTTHLQHQLKSHEKE